MKKLFLLTVLISAVSLTACTHESSSTTSFDISTTTDEGIKNYSYKSENVNGEVTTESSVTETTNDEDEDDMEYEVADGDDTEYEVADGDEIDSGVVMEAEWLDEGLADAWDNDSCGHDVSYDEDTIYVHIWSGEIESSDELDEESMRNDTIPSWIEATQDWMEEFKNDGMEDLHICLQDVSEPNGEVFFTIEDGEVTYFVLDEE